MTGVHLEMILSDGTPGCGLVVACSAPRVYLAAGCRTEMPALLDSHEEVGAFELLESKAMLIKLSSKKKKTRQKM